MKASSCVVGGGSGEGGGRGPGTGVVSGGGGPAALLLAPPPTRSPACQPGHHAARNTRCTHLLHQLLRPQLVRRPPQRARDVQQDRQEPGIVCTGEHRRAVGLWGPIKSWQHPHAAAPQHPPSSVIRAMLRSCDQDSKCQAEGPHKVLAPSDKAQRAIKYRAAFHRCPCAAPCFASITIRLPANRDRGRARPLLATTSC